MFKRIIVLSMIVVFIFGGYVPRLVAAQRVYGGIDYVNIDYSKRESFIGDYKADPKAMSLKLGILISSYLAIETRYAFGIQGDNTSNALGVDMDLDLDNAYGIYTLGIFPILDKFKVYGILGYTGSKVTVNDTGFGISISESESDISYGFGAEIKFNDHIAAAADYMKFIDTDDYEYSGLSFGLIVYFN